MKRSSVVVGLMLVSLAATMVVGCGGKVSKENYDKITNGMALSEVEDLLGKGEKKAGGAVDLGTIVGAGDIYVWKDGEKEITVTFKDGKVVAKAESGL